MNIGIKSVVVHSFSSTLPTKIVTNADLSACMDTSDEWIRQRTGIETRHWAEPPTTTSDLGTESARDTLLRSGLVWNGSAWQGHGIPDAIIAATLSPDYCFPGIGVAIQSKLGLGTIPAFDIRNQCSGFLYSLEAAAALVNSGCYKNILVVGAEVHSTGLDVSTRGRDIAVLFGDGAGSCMVSARSDNLPQNSFDFLGSELHSDGRHIRELWCEHPGSATYPVRLTEEIVREAGIFPHMNGRKVFENAVKRMTEVSLALLDKLGLSPADINCFVPHQANIRINQMVAQQLGLGEDQVVSTIQRVGNTTAASIPIGMCEAISGGKLKPGGYVLNAAFGSGFTWGATVLRYRTT